MNIIIQYRRFNPYPDPILIVNIIIIILNLHLRIKENQII